jgi:hypothetical protein
LNYSSWLVRACRSHVAKSSGGSTRKEKRKEEVFGQEGEKAIGYTYFQWQYFAQEGIRNLNFTLEF